jgi:sugar O-acyltransferase (sialic acid O-acetyltransferase NeuD family)
VNQKPLLLIGAGGHAEACIDVVEQEGRCAVAGLIGSAAEVGKQLCGYSVIGTDEDLPALIGQFPYALIAIGHIKTAEPRIRLFDRLQAMGYAMPVIVSSHAYVSKHASVGAGSIVMHGAVVNAGASIGRNCIVNSQSLVEHDAVIGDHCHVATAAAVNGGARIGAGTFIGSGSRIREGVTVGERCRIGMGQLVVADCETGTFQPRETSK